MQLYKRTMANKKVDRPTQTISVSIDEKPERKIPTKFKTPKDKTKFIFGVERLVRGSEEYKSYIKFLKDNYDMRRCAVLRNLDTSGGKKYTIELHHEPFTLFEIVNAIIDRRMALSYPLDPFDIADECMALHYDGLIGLIPLAKTHHELVHAGKIFIPLNLIYHNYQGFYNEYEGYFDPKTIERIQTKVNLSLTTQDIISDTLDTEFINIVMDGVDFVQVPPEWQNILKLDKDE